MRIGDLFRRKQAPGDFCGPPPRGAVRPRQQVAAKDGDACTACGHALEPVAALRVELRQAGAAWWCTRCGLQFSESESGG